MKKLLSNLTYILLVGTFFLFLMNCSEEGKSDSDLVGFWNVTNVEYDAFVGSMTVENYFLNELGLSQQEAAIALKNFNDRIEAYLESTSIEFEADFYYWTNIGDIAGDEGEWSINSSETLIILDQGTIWETSITVNSLSSSSLNISFTMDDDIDLDEDVQTPDVEVTFNMAMQLSK